MRLTRLVHNLILCFRGLFKCVKLIRRFGKMFKYVKVFTSIVTLIRATTEQIPQMRVSPQCSPFRILWKKNQNSLIFDQIWGFKISILMNLGPWNCSNFNSNHILLHKNAILMISKCRLWPNSRVQNVDFDEF